MGNKKSFYDIFSDLNKIPRPSHHEGRVADYLCHFAESHGLKYKRDAENCVVIEKPATPGYENADTVVILNHMDMVCVAKDDYLRDGRKFNPLEDEIRPYVEVDKDGKRWMKAEGTSLGADNGMGLSMALAILADDTIVHPALEVLTTTNEEDGMSGAEALSKDFISGRKVINLDSEAYNEITVGAAGACLQVGRWDLQYATLPEGYKCYKIIIDGGLGGHSGVDINKGRCNCNKTLCSLIANSYIDEKQKFKKGFLVCSINGGTANASIASWAEAVVAVPLDKAEELACVVAEWSKTLKEQYVATDPDINICIDEVKQCDYIVDFNMTLWAIANIPCGVDCMREDLPDTVMTSNNIGVIKTEGSSMSVSCHTRSFDNKEQNVLSEICRNQMIQGNAVKVDMLMNTLSWVERADSPLLAMTCATFKEVLGFEPKKVAMHFVLEAAYYVEKYPGVEIASIGPLIIEPHSTSERVCLDTADDIWKVTIELLRRLAEEK